LFENLKGKSRLKLEDNIKSDNREIGWQVATGVIWFRIRTASELFEYYAQPLCGKFLDLGTGF
jgi:hypothetical protein